MIDQFTALFTGKSMDNGICFLFFLQSNITCFDHTAKWYVYFPIISVNRSGNGNDVSWLGNANVAYILPLYDDFKPK